MKILRPENNPKDYKFPFKYIEKHYRVAFVFYERSDIKYCQKEYGQYFSFVEIPSEKYLDFLFSVALNKMACSPLVFIELCNKK